MILQLGKIKDAFYKDKQKCIKVFAKFFFQKNEVGIAILKTLTIPH